MGRIISFLLNISFFCRTVIYRPKMGRRPGSTTKSGRFMNPADQERKSMRQKELKRNRKQRTMVRHAILKSKDVDEILENLSRLDDQGDLRNYLAIFIK